MGFFSPSEHIVRLLVFFHSVCAVRIAFTTSTIITGSGSTKTIENIYSDARVDCVIILKKNFDYSFLQLGYRIDPSYINLTFLFFRLKPSVKLLVEFDRLTETKKNAATKRVFNLQSLAFIIRFRSAHLSLEFSVFIALMVQC